MQRFTEFFAVLPDPRASNTRHDLTEILFIAIAATLCGARTCTDMALFAEAKAPLLREILALKHGPPSHDTFSAVFRLLDPKAFAQVFGRFAAAVGTAVAAQGRTIALDGKALRRAYEKGRAHAPKIMVTAWACEMRATLAAVPAVNGNEAEAALHLLTYLDLDGATVTADALHCHREMAAAIRARGGDYVLALKGNQGPLHRDAEALAARRKRGVSAATTEIAHDRAETRRARVIEAASLGETHGFAGLAAIGIVERTRRQGTREERSLSTFILSRRLKPARLLEIVRRHWDIENGLHWALDVLLDEDGRRNRKDNGPHNLALLGRLVLNVARADKTKGSLAGKLKRAGWDDAFLLKLLAQMR